MNSRRLDFSDVSLYAVSSSVQDEVKFLKTVEQLLSGGVDAIQLRDKALSDRQYFELGKKVKALCHRADALFIVNNRADLALALESDGLHIGHTDLPISKVRELVGHRIVLGVSTHSLPQAIEAQKAGADYVSCGPVWATPTKPTYEPVGLGLVGLYRAAMRTPFVAIGGIDLKNIDQVIQSGAKTVAVVRALFEAENPQEAAKAFKNKLTHGKSGSMAMA